MTLFRAKRRLLGVRVFGAGRSLFPTREVGIHGQFQLWVTVSREGLLVEHRGRNFQQVPLVQCPCQAFRR